MKSHSQFRLVLLIIGCIASECGGVQEKKSPEAVDAATIAGYASIGGVYFKTGKEGFLGFPNLPGPMEAFRFQDENFGDVKLPEVKAPFALFFQYCEFPGDGLKGLGHLKKLKMLGLESANGEPARGVEPRKGGTPINDDVLKSMPPLGLTTLILQSSRITDDGLKFLAVLKDLETLRLDFAPRIKGPGFEHLTPLKKLAALELRNCTRLTNDGLKGVAALTDLTSLDLFCCKKIGDDGLKNLTVLSKLTSLNLSVTRVTDKGLENLAHFKNLRNLSLASLPITDDGMDHLLPLKNLSSLDLSFTPIADDGLKKIQQLKSLTVLRIQGCNELLAEDIDEFRKAMPKCDIQGR